MEALLAIASPDKGRELVLPLSLGGIRVRQVVYSGHQLVAEASREPVDAILIAESLPDGPADLWLAKLASGPARRPVALVLLYGLEGGEAVRERCRGAFGPAVEVIPAGARAVHETAAEAARLLDRLSRLLAEQDQDAHERLRQPIPSAQIPQPVRKGGALALLGASGGVGTSALVANLGLLVAMAGERVLLVDAQFGTAGSLAHFLGVQPDEAQKGLHHLKWGHVSGREGSPEEVLTRTEEVRLRAVRHAELRLLHAPATLDAMLNLPGEQVLWGMQTLERSFDLILIDLGTGLGSPRTLKILEAASRILLLAGGWGASVQSAARILTALEGRPELDRLFLLLRETGEGVWGARTVRSVVSQPIYGRLPEEPLLQKADGRLGASVPPIAEAPDSPYSSAVSALAASLGLVAFQDGNKEGKGKKGLFGLGLGRR
jgi:MinD-like ATPase involved in chromosome partitioning or flagellar assembly